MTRSLESPVIAYLIIGSFSLLAAGLMFLIGGSLAEVSGQEGSFLGFGFRAGGAFGGFVIVFWISLTILERLRRADGGNQASGLKLPLKAQPSKFDRAGSYRCKYWLYDTQTGDNREFPATYTWEAGFLTIYIRDVGENDMIKVRVEDGQKSWESEHFDARTRETAVTLVQP